MPPDGLSAMSCQLAAPEGRLVSPRVLQLDRADDTSPSEPHAVLQFS